jgi:glutathione S-transferase
MKLYWGKHKCAIGIHMLPEEIDKPYETEDRGDRRGRQPHSPAPIPCGQLEG